MTTSAFVDPRSSESNRAVFIAAKRFQTWINVDGRGAFRLYDNGCNLPTEMHFFGALGGKPEHIQLTWNLNE